MLAHPLRRAVTGTLDDARYGRWTFDGRRGELIRVARAVDAPGGLDSTCCWGRTRTLLGGHWPFDHAVDEFERPPMGLTRWQPRASASPFIPLGSTRSPWSRRRLAARRAVRACAGWPGLLPRLRWLVYNGRSAALSDDDSEDWFIFQGRASDEITLRMAAGESALDPFLILTDGAGYELARADDTPDGVPDAVVAGFVLPADGSYLVRATRYGFEHGPSAGGYTLTIETDAAPVEVGAAAPEPLTPGVAVNGALDLETVARRYTFSGRAGERATVVVARTTGTLDPALAPAPDSTLIA